MLYHGGTSGRGPCTEVAKAAERRGARSSREETAHTGHSFCRRQHSSIGHSRNRLLGDLHGFDRSARTPVAQTDVRAQFVQPGFLVFVRDNALMAQRFDPNTQALTGHAQSLASGVFTFASAGVAAMTVSPTAIGYLDSSIETRNSQLKWIDRSGKPIGMIGDVADYVSINLSHDDKSWPSSQHEREELRRVEATSKGAHIPVPREAV